MRFFDTHAHLNDEAFTDLNGVWQRAEAAGVLKIMLVGVDHASSEQCVELTRHYSNFVASVGIQPNYVAQTKPTDWDAIVELAHASRVVALGETGLDRYWNDTPFDQQQDYFDRHLRLSQALNIPFIVHMRDCGADVAAMLREARQRGKLRGVMHSFTGDLALAEECLSLGLHISFAGMVTYKKSADLRVVAAAIPADRILIETDSPYLAPEPKRGQRPNEPALVVHTAACLAEVRGVSLADLANQTWENACRLFGIESTAGG